MAREITLWLVRNAHPTEMCWNLPLFTSEPVWQDEHWDTPRGPIGTLDIQTVREHLGRDIQLGEKVKLTVTVGRRQKARKG